MRTLMRLLATYFVCGSAALAWAQTTPAPAPAVTAGQKATVPASELDKKTPGVDGSHTTTTRSRKNDPGFKPPMSITIREEGIAMPKCARESRDGESCK